MVEIATDWYARDYGLTGPEIHRRFGYYTDVLGSYPMDDKPSRWVIFQRGMEALTAEDQHEMLRELVAHDGRDDPRLRKLRSYLSTGVAPTSRTLLSELDWERVEDSWNEALRLSAENPSAAIRAARTTLESVCKHICDERDHPYPKTGELVDLYRSVQGCLALAPVGANEQTSKQLLSGIGTTLNALGAMRNELGDAHGKGINSAEPRDVDARLVVNTSFSVAQFLIDCHRAEPIT